MVTGSTSESGPEVFEALRTTIERARQSSLYSERLRNIELRELDDFRDVPLTTRQDLTRAGLHGTRAVPLDRVCHYGETSGTTGEPNSTWLTAEDLARNARTIADRHPDVFAPGRILMNRFPFMAAPAHLIQLIAQQGGGVAIPAGNINWDVPFPRALELAQRTGAQVLAGLPLEPIVLAQIAQARGLDPAKDLAIDTFFLGGAPLPPILQKRIERAWGAELYDQFGCTEGSAMGSESEHHDGLHFWTDLFHIEVVDEATGAPTPEGDMGILVMTPLWNNTITPFLRWNTGDYVSYVDRGATDGPLSVFPVIRHAARTAGFFKVRGINVNQADIEDFMHRQDTISDFKIEAVETGTLDALRVSVELRRGTEATDETEQLSRSVKSTFELTPEVVVLEPGTLEREFAGQVKQVRFIDRRG